MQTTANTTATSHINYNAYGYTKMLIQGRYTSGFNGAYFDIHTHGYHLGQGYRMYSPALPRFTSPDFLSPFGRGGINAYAYCNGDPVNRIDPHGTSAILFIAGILQRGLKQAMKPASKGAYKAANTDFHRDRNIQVNAVSRLMNDYSRDPTGVTARVKHLPPNVLAKGTGHLKLNDPGRIWASHMTDVGYIEQHENIMMQRNISYDDDGRQTSLTRLFLERFARSSSNPKNHPEDLKRSLDYYYETRKRVEEYQNVMLAARH
ncbi:RHS repeat-associated core domain-containing protein [Pseudomonas putida]|uniref:RHS repeat-associated core domain-containing protein n=1 Tax=Pseudomonas putida TaxID=303 RepID=A0AAP9SQF1_PSEPU|nr:RHS repeat-associated core domain-containing protein [Pseudomonas putida]QJQ11741.1 RHS repeat-associated core domain-containing protein [Pseudomonas putida]